MDQKGNHVDLDKFSPENFNIGLTNSQLETISMKRLKELIKLFGKKDKEVNKKQRIKM